MRTALLTLKEGQISDVLEVEGQFVILKMISPKIPRHFEAAKRAEREGKLPQAIQEIQAALRLEEDNVQAYLKLALLQQSAKKFDLSDSVSRKGPALCAPGDAVDAPDSECLHARRI